MASLKQVFLATRPWSFPMTVMAIGVGASYALWMYEAIDLPLTLMALLGAVLLHAAVNVWNDYYDYRYGVDRPETGTAIYRPHPLIHGFMTPSQVMVLATGSAAAAIAVGAAIAVMGRPLALLLGVIGVALAYWYTGPPLHLKYRGLGEPVVAIVWGPLITGGAYYVASGFIDLNVVAISIPLGLLVAAVLLANNIRDIETDAKLGAITLAVRLGRDRAIKLYQAMLITPYILHTALVLARLLPPHTLAVLATLPAAVNLARSFSREVPTDADPRTARVVLLYGIVMLVSLLVAAFTR
jgi:1,4-dihydroxy-2-naphthoate octaprenyltransferase